jgi:hypothetical protein
MSFEIHPKNIVMTTLEEVLEEARRAFEAHTRLLKSVGKPSKNESSKSFSHASRRIGKARSHKSRKLFYLLPVARPR